MYCCPFQYVAFSQRIFQNTQIFYEKHKKGGGCLRTMFLNILGCVFAGESQHKRQLCAPPPPR
jgi:hypothetical protein